MAQQRRVSTLFSQISPSTEAEKLKAIWEQQKKDGTYAERPYTAEDVIKLRNPNQNKLTIQKKFAAQFKKDLKNMDAKSTEHFKALGAYTPWQALNMSKGLKKAKAEAKAAGHPEPHGAIYLSGWMIAALANDWGIMSDQSMHPKNAVPELVRRINKFFDDEDTFARSRGELAEGETFRLPIVVDIDSGFGGNVATFRLAKEVIEAGAAAIHIEDQDSNQKKCGHMGGKVLVSTREHIEKISAVRLATDVLGLHDFTIISRTDALEATLINNITDPRDHETLKGKIVPTTANIPKNTITIKQDEKHTFIPEVTEDGFFGIKSDVESSRKRVIGRHKAFAPFADLLWTETKNADLEEIDEINSGVQEDFPGKKFAYNCSPSFNWDLNFRTLVLERWKKDKDPKAANYEGKNLLELPDSDELVIAANKLIAEFQRELAKRGSKFNFITLPSYHWDALMTQRVTINYHRFKTEMLAYTKDIQAAERHEKIEALHHQKGAGTDYYDKVALTIKGGKSSTTAMTGSTEEAQFKIQCRL